MLKKIMYPIFDEIEAKYSEEKAETYDIVPYGIYEDNHK